MGFDYYYGFLNQAHAHNHFPSFLWRNGGKVPFPNDINRVGPVDGVGYATKKLAYAGDLFAADAKAFVVAHTDDSLSTWLVKQPLKPQTLSFPHGSFPITFFLCITLFST